MNDHVKCAVCGRRKKPIGRDSMDNGLCDRDCPGYSQEPHAGHLWPSEIGSAPVGEPAVPLCAACASGDHQWHTGGELLGPGSCVNGECRCEVRPVVPAAPESAASYRDCTCVSHCKGVAGMAEGWRCQVTGKMGELGETATVKP